MYQLIICICIYIYMHIIYIYHHPLFPEVVVPERRISAWGYYAKNRNVHLGKKPTARFELAMAGVKVHIFLRQISESHENRIERWGKFSL